MPLRFFVGCFSFLFSLLAVAFHRLALLLCAGSLLAGCSLMLPQPQLTTYAPDAWQATLPHAGQTEYLRDWWKQFDDPLIARLIDIATQESPQLAEATARIAQARALLRGAHSSFFPSLDANASGTRSKTELPPTPGTQTIYRTTLDAGWEIDIFGVTRHTARAAEARLARSGVQWHEARVSLAAEVAMQYINLRTCEQRAALDEQDTQSQRASAALIEKKVAAGFEAPANGALARAGAAEAASRWVTQQAECTVLIKALVALTGLPEKHLREQLQAGKPATLPQPTALTVPGVPAQALSQRPDLAASEREIAALIADAEAAQANRFPRMFLNGSVGRLRLDTGSVALDGDTWSFGPALVLPLFDAGRRKAAVELAQARYDEQVARYRQQVRNAVREVEEALVRLDAAARREADAVTAASGYQAFFVATQARWDSGIGSLLDLEQARRSWLNAQATLLQVQRERVLAWVSLYKAMGGGWMPSQAEKKE